MQPHYIYSPREMTRWVRGICEALRPLETLPIEGLVRIWAHEALRLFHDRLDNINLVANINTYVFVSCPQVDYGFAFRLVLDEERRWTEENIDSTALKHFPNISRDDALQRPILYSCWLSKDYIPVEREELRDYVKARLKVHDLP